MKPSNYNWIFGALFIVFIIVISILFFFPSEDRAMSSDPWENVPLKVPHTDH